MAVESDGDAVMQTLLANHRRFLDFLDRRTGNRAEAEDVLQNAFVRALEKGGDLRDSESAVAWFYRLLRNALVDRHRSDSARRRALETKADLTEEAQVYDDELRNEICRCVLDLLPNLKADHAELLRRIDLDGESVADVAGSLGITPNNTRVKLHRARKALLGEVQRSCRTCADHGCLDCSCKR